MDEIKWGIKGWRSGWERFQNAKKMLTRGGGGGAKTLPNNAKRKKVTVLGSRALRGGGKMV